MNWLNLLWDNSIDYNKHWNNCDRIKTRNILEHGLITWFVKHVIKHDVAAIDKDNYD